MTDFRHQPQYAATPLGPVVLLGTTGDLAHDIAAALQYAGGDFSVAEVTALLDQERERVGLQAEAGYPRHALSVIFITHSETLASGKHAVAWLTLMRTPLGDAVLWNVGIMDRDMVAMFAADRRQRDLLLELLRKAAGGPSTEIQERRHQPEGDLP